MKITKILLAIDGDSSGGAIAVAAGLARRLDARITVAHFERHADPSPVTIEDDLDSLERFGVAVDIRVEHSTAGASIADSLLTLSEDLQPDMVVLGSRGRAAPLATIFGSVSREVARRSRIPVLIVREGALQPDPPARLLLVVTEETLGSAELDVGIELAQGLRAKVIVLHVHGRLEETVADALGVPANRRLHHLTDVFLSKLRAAGIEADLVITSNHDGLAGEISRAAVGADCDLIVIPSGTSDAAERWLLGTVVEEVARRSHSPVLVAPSTPTRGDVP